MALENQYELDPPIAEGAREIQYQVATARRQAVEDRAWQVPAIIFAAQALLLNVATGHDVSRATSVAAGLSDAFVAIMAANLIMRQRRNQLAEYAWLRDFEYMHGWDPVHWDSSRRAQRVVKIEMNWTGDLFAKIPPHRTWLIGTLGLGLLGLALSIYVITTGKAV